MNLIVVGAQIADVFFLLWSHSAKEVAWLLLEPNVNERMSTYSQNCQPNTDNCYYDLYPKTKIC